MKNSKRNAVSFGASGAPVVLGDVSVNAHKQAAALLGTSPSVERVAGFGYCFVDDTAHGAARGAWNRRAA